jgi:hypothetical protein
LSNKFADTMNCSSLQKCVRYLLSFLSSAVSLLNVFNCTENLSSLQKFKEISLTPLCKLSGFYVGKQFSLVWNGLAYLIMSKYGYSFSDGPVLLQWTILPVL